PMAFSIRDVSSAAYERGAAPRGLRDEGCPVDGRPARLRALRDLSAAVPDLSRARRGDGLAARADLSDASCRGGEDRLDADDGPSPRSLPRVSGLRERLSLRRAVRTSAGGHARTV